MDTANKRQSALNWESTTDEGMPIPSGDAVITQGDQQHFLSSYSGQLWPEVEDLGQCRGLVLGLGIAIPKCGLG